MNPTIPFEVVNSSNETFESQDQSRLTLQVNSGIKIAPEVAVEINSGDAPEFVVTESAIEISAESERPAKKIKAKKLKGRGNGDVVESALAAVAGIEVVEAIEDNDSTEFDSNPFEEFNLIPAVVASIEAAGYTNPTPIQTETIPHILSGKDIIGRAETGSGKTAAFACPLLSMIDVNIKLPQVLVLAPTRELAIQVTKSFEKYGSELTGFRAVTIYGGQSYEIQNSALRKGVQVVVGTPGRIMDHLRQGTLNLSSLKTIVLDEGDEMLRMGFIDDVEWILQQIPSQRQTLLFSATMPAPIQKIANSYLHKPVNISIMSESATAESIEQYSVLVQPRTKIDMLAQILESEETDGVIVFVKTRDTTIGIADQLSQRGFSAAPLNGEIPQNQRERTIQHLKSGRLNVLVATDVAARGLDVQRISHVFNFDFPHDTEAYIHRIGRTGRAGREGTAILFVEPKEQGKLKRLQRETNQQIGNYRQKSVDELNQIRIQRFKQRITESLADLKSIELFAKIVAEYQQENDIPLEQIAAALATMAQGDSPLLLKQVVNPRSNFKSEADRKGKRYQGEMTSYRVEVGRNHGVGPGNIVGAITNEAGLDYASIGRIKLFDDFSVIDLPTSLSPKTLAGLQNVIVSGRELRISKDQRPGRGRSDRFQDRERGERSSEPSKRGSRKGSGSSDRASLRDNRSTLETSKVEFDKPKKKFRSREFGTLERKSGQRKFERESSVQGGKRIGADPSTKKPNKLKRKFVKVRGSK